VVAFCPRGKRAGFGGVFGFGLETGGWGSCFGEGLADGFAFAFAAASLSFAFAAVAAALPRFGFFAGGDFALSALGRFLETVFAMDRGGKESVSGGKDSVSRREEMIIEHGLKLD
jgi:hypothetical protein